MSFAFSANPIDPSTNYLQGKTLSGYPTASNPTYVGTYAEESLLINKAISNPQSQPSAFGDGSGGSLEIVPGPAGNSAVVLSTFNDVYAKTTLNVEGGPLQVGIPTREDTLTINTGASGSSSVNITASGVDAVIHQNLIPKGTGSVTAGDVNVSDCIQLQPGTAGSNAVSINAVGQDANINQNIVPKGTGSVTLGNTSAGDGLTVFPQAAGSNVVRIQSSGPDSSIAMNFQTKGNGSINLGDPTQSTNGVQIQPSGAGAGYANISAVGPDAAINLNLSSKGAGVVTMPSAQINGNLNCMSNAIIQPGHSWGGSTFPTILVWAIMDLYCVSSTSTGIGTGTAVFGGAPDPGNVYSTGASGAAFEGNPGVSTGNTNFILTHNATGLSSKKIPIYMGGNAVANHYFMDTSGDFASQPPTRFRLIVRGIITNQFVSDGAYTVPLCVIEDTAAAQDTAHILKSWTHNCTNTNRGMATSISPWMSFASAYTVFLNLYTNSTSNDFYPLHIYAQYAQ